MQALGRSFLAVGIAAMFLAGCAQSVEPELPQSCEEAHERVRVGARPPTIDREGPVMEGEALPVYDISGSLSAVDLYARSYSMACIGTDEDPRPTPELWEWAKAARDGNDHYVEGPYFSASPDIYPTYWPLGTEAVWVRFPGGEDSPEEFDYGGPIDEGIGPDGARELARSWKDELVAAGVWHELDDFILREPRIVRAISGNGQSASWVESYKFAFGVQRGGLTVIGPDLDVEISRDGVLNRLSIADPDVEEVALAETALDEDGAAALLEQLVGEKYGEEIPMSDGEAFWVSFSADDASEVDLRWVAQIPGRIVWVSFADPDAGLGEY